MYMIGAVKPEGLCCVVSFSGGLRLGVCTTPWTHLHQIPASLNLTKYQKICTKLIKYTHLLTHFRLRSLKTVALSLKLEAHVQAKRLRPVRCGELLLYVLLCGELLLWSFITNQRY